MRKRSEIGKPKSEEKPSEQKWKERMAQHHIEAAERSEATKPKLEKVTCAKCGLEQPGGTSDCITCGERLPEFKLVTGASPKEPPPMENLSKLAYDLKSKDLDVTLAQLAATPVDDRRELQKWVDAKSPDVTPRVRMILERLNPNPPPLAGSGSHDPVQGAIDDVFKSYTPTPEEERGKESKSAFRSDSTRPSAMPSTNVSSSAFIQAVGDEVTYTLGKEMYRVTEFCTFDVGPISATTRVRERETALQALERVRNDVEAFAESERIRKRDSYMATWKGIKPAFKKVVKEQAAEED